MEGKIITCCGDCGYYDLKNHRCKNGYNDDANPKKHFYSDCKTLEDLEEHDAKVRADAIDWLFEQCEHNKMERFDGIEYHDCIDLGWLRLFCDKVKGD